MLPFEERLAILDGVLEKTPREELMKELGLYEVVRTEEEAYKIASNGDKIGIGYPKSHLVYRMNKSVGKDGEVIQSLSFQYHV